MDKKDRIQLVNNAKKGDRKAFAKLYNEYHDRLYFFVLKNVHNKEAAEDITQDTFLKSIEKISDLKESENYSSWLHSIAYNKCKDFFRNESHTAYFDTDEEKENAMEDFSLNEPVMVSEDYAVNKESSEMLKKMIDGLKPDMKSALILYYYDDMSVAEVAQTLGLKENAAKQKLFQARKKLKAKIDKLVKSGVVMCAVPIGDVLKHTVTPKYAAAIKSAGVSAAAGTSLSAKIVGISAAAVIAVGTPVGLFVLNNKGTASVQGNVKLLDSDNNIYSNQE